MRPLRALLIYTASVFLLGPLIAPWLYHMAQVIAPDSHLAQSSFHRYLDRSLLLIALVGIWPLLRAIGAASWNAVGLSDPRGQGRRLAGGFALGFCSLAVVAGVTVACHARDPCLGGNAYRLPVKLGGPALTAIVVALLEELLFRGVIFGAFRRTWDWRAALLVSSMIYAIVHFLRPDDLPGPVTWSSGFRLMPVKLAGFVDLPALIPGFLNLTLAGMLLGIAYQRTRTLYFSIGLHAGWIFWFKSYNLFTVSVPGASTWIWGTEKLIDGWIALPVLALCLPLLLRLSQAGPMESQRPAQATSDDDEAFRNKLT